MFNQPWMYIVLIGAVLFIFSRFLPKGNTSNPNRQMLSDMEETMESFSADMEEQNRVVIELFAETKRAYEQQISKLTGRIETLETRELELSRQIGMLNKSVEQLASAPQPVVQAAAAVGVHENVFKQQIEPEVVKMEEAKPASLINLQERYARVFELHEQGKSVETIAKKLGMNKGEINLILQLSKQEEKLNV